MGRCSAVETWPPEARLTTRASHHFYGMRGSDLVAFRGRLRDHRITSLIRSCGFLAVQDECFPKHRLAAYVNCMPSATQFLGAYVGTLAVFVKVVVCGRQPELPRRTGSVCHRRCSLRLVAYRRPAHSSPAHPVQPSSAPAQLRLAQPSPAQPSIVHQLGVAYQSHGYVLGVRQ